MRLQTEQNNADHIDQAAQYKIFVEGKPNDIGIDAVVIRELLRNNRLSHIEVIQMNSCENVRNAAHALIKAHPHYYFLIDRDDRSLETVESSWRDFPNPEKQNMLIWRKRELENYFLAPNYLVLSTFLKVTPEQLKQEILETCKRRFYLDAANLTLMSIGKEIRQLFKIPGFFKEVTDFKNQKNGEQQLDAAISPKLQVMTDNIDSERQESFIQKRYCAFIAELSGGVFPLEYGHGTWLERMSGKEIFHDIANNCFEVTTANKVILHGEPQYKEIVKSLLKLPLEQQPEDFQALVGLLKRQSGSIY